VAVSELVRRALEHLHGHLGWLAALALWHPAILLRRTKRRLIGVSIAATVLVSLTAVLGATVYPAYRVSIKPHLFAVVPVVGAIFERKEHLGVAAVALAWLGLALHWLDERDPATQPHLARAARVAYVGAAAFSAVAAGLGVVVAVHRSF
jgi:hypothetical protein